VSSIKYRKKPVVVHAVKWDGKVSTLAPLWQHATIEEAMQDFLSDDLLIPTPEGKMRAKPGDWIICGVQGELYPCKSDIFEATYEPAEEAQT
jgi:hypothetical protein